MKKKLLFGFLAAMLVTGTILAGCAEPTDEEVEPVRIGAIIWRTGYAKTDGDRVLRGIYFAVKEINEQGGILGGRQIEIKEYDEGYTAGEVTTAVKEAMADGCVALVAFGESATAEAGAAAVAPYGVPLCIPHSGNSHAARDGYYGLAHFMYYQELEMNAVANWTEAQGLKRGIQIAYDTAFSRYCEEALRERWDRPGSPVELLPSIYMPCGQVEASFEITRALAQEPDIVFCHFWGAEMLVDALRRFEELGYEGELMIAGTCLTHEHVAMVPEAAEGAYCPYMFVRDPRIPETVEWADRFVAEYGREPSTPAAQAYEATKLLLLAMDKAGTDSDLEKIADAMHTIHFMTPRGEEMSLVKRLSGGAEVYMTRIFLTQAQDGKLVAADYLPVKLGDYDEAKIVD